MSATKSILKRRKQSETPQTLPKKLVLDLIGPYVVHFTDGCVRVHAPLCVDHHANILTDTTDTPLIGNSAPAPSGPMNGFVYGLTGPLSHRGNCQFRRYHELLVLTSQIAPIDVGNCNLMFEAPNPDVMLPLLPEQIWIHRNGSSTWVDPKNGPKGDIITGRRARGLRLVYKNCPQAPAIDIVGAPATFHVNLPSSIGGIKAEALGMDPPHYHVTVRFASNSAAPDEHHEDAYACFSSMRTLIPETMTWRVDFDDSSVTAKEPFILLHHSGPTPVDCGAAVLVARDTK